MDMTKAIWINMGELMNNWVVPHKIINANCFGVEKFFNVLSDKNTVEVKA
jgi:hypothetical protein